MKEDEMDALGPTNRQQNATEDRQQIATRKRWVPPRGVRLILTKDGRPKPHLVQWLVDGRRQVKGFATAADQLVFAKSLASTAAAIGIEAFRLNPDEAREWRALKAEIAPASIQDLLRVWKAYGSPSAPKMTVREAAVKFFEIRAKQKLADDSKSHADLHMKRFLEVFGDVRLVEVKTDEIRKWTEGLKNSKTGAPMEPYTIGHHIRTVKSFFKMAVLEKWTGENPSLPIKPPGFEGEDVAVLSIADARKLFEVNAGALCVGRLALEAFGGMRTSSAERLRYEDIRFEDLGIVLPGAKHKTGKRHYVSGYPDNLWDWIRHAPRACWDVSERQYQEDKISMFRAAGLRPRSPADGKAWNKEEIAQFDRMRNTLRHSFCSYHTAAFKDAVRTAFLLTHSTPTMLYKHYQGMATAADAAAYFAIRPPTRIPGGP